MEDYRDREPLKDSEENAQKLIDAVSGLQGATFQSAAVVEPSGAENLRGALRFLNRLAQENKFIEITITVRQP